MTRGAPGPHSHLQPLGVQGLAASITPGSARQEQQLWERWCDPNSGCDHLMVSTVTMATILSPRMQRVELQGSARGAEMGYRVTDWGHGGGMQGDAGEYRGEAAGRDELHGEGIVALP